MNIESERLESVEFQRFNVKLKFLESLMSRITKHVHRVAIVPSLVANER